MFRVRTLEDVREFCLSDEPDKRSYSYAARNWVHRHGLLELADFLLANPTPIWTKRIEHSIIDFYTNDKDFYDVLSTTFESTLIHRFEPSEESAELLDDSSKIVVKKLPHNKYNYRVYLLPHKMANNREGKQKFVDWLKRQSPKITCTTAIEHWFIKTDWNWDRRYVLVEDEATLLMLKLRNAEVVGRIYNFVISDK